jgi:hypothetical protein
VISGNEQDRDGILGALTRFGRGKVAPTAESGGKGYVPPSRKNRKSVTTWQDEAVLKQLKDISHERGIPQQVLIAEGLNYVLAKYRKSTVATCGAKYCPALYNLRSACIGLPLDCPQQALSEFIELLRC